MSRRGSIQQNRGRSPLVVTAAPYDPYSEGTVFADWNPAQATTLTLNGSKVASIASYTNHDAGKLLAQGTDANRPILTSSNASFGNKPTMDFAGLGGLICASNVTGAPVTQPFTTFFVASSTVTDKHLFGTSSAAAPFINTGLNGGGGADCWEFSDATGNFYASIINATTPAVLAVVWSGTSSAVYISARTAKISGTNLGAIGMTKLSLGDRPNTGRVMTGSIARAIIFSAALSDAACKRVISSFGTTYGITIGA